MQEYEAFLGVMAVFVLLIGGIVIFLSVISPTSIYFSGLSDQECKEIAGKTPEAGKFLSKYGNSTIRLDHGERLAVDYLVERNNTYLRLRIFVNEHNGRILGKEVECYSEGNSTIVKENILQYLETENCLGNYEGQLPVIAA